MTDQALTRLAATAIMGWRTLTASGIDWWEPARVSQNGWQPLTDWRAAGEIIEKMRADGWTLRIDIYSGWQCAFFWKQTDVTEAFQSPVDGTLSVPRAITIAALRAVGAIGEAERLSMTEKRCGTTKEDTDETDR